MDLMSIRRGLMAQMANDIWKKMSVIVPTTITNNASDVADWLQTLVPKADYAIIVRDSELTDGVSNATLYVATRFKGNLFDYIRIYSKALQSQTNWASTYYLTVTAGDKYTVFYQ